jgi:hypothetical protein
VGYILSSAHVPCTFHVTVLPVSQWSTCLWFSRGSMRSSR